jgi:putative N6-adenine-specific DNA methylase
MVFVRLLDDMVTVSVDASGTLLHKRGYRLRVGQAPLRETLASACIKAANFTGDTPLWDPFCGSGTIAVEAARMVLGHPNVDRSFAFEHWPTHNSEGFDNLKQSLTLSASLTHPIFASDRDKKEISNASENMKSANLSPAITLAHSDFEAQGVHIPQYTTIITNLPYGHRTAKGADLWDTFKRLGAFLNRRRDLGPVWVLSGQPGFSKATGLKWTTALKFQNRGLEVALLKLKRKVR